MAAPISLLTTSGFTQETAPAHLLPYGIAAAAVLILAIVLLYRRRSGEASTGYSSSRVLSSLALVNRLFVEGGPDNDDPSQAILRAVGQVFPGRSIELGEFDSAGYRSVARCSRGADIPGYEVRLLDQAGHALHFLRGYTLPITNDELVHLNGNPLWPELNRLAGERALFLPLRYHSETIGLLILKNHIPFSEHDIATAQSLQSVLASSLHQVQLKEEVQVRANQLLLISEISRRLISLQPLESRMGAVAPLISRIFDNAQVAIYGWEDAGVVLMAASHEVPDRGAHEQDATRGLVGASAREGRKKEFSGARDASSQPAAELALPLMIEDRLFGVLHIRDQQGRIFEAERQAIAEMIGAQLAIAVLESRNYSSQQEYTWINTVLLEVARHAAKPGDPDDALRAVLQLATLLAGADWAAVFRSDDSSTNLRLGPNAGIDRDTIARLEDTIFRPEEFGLSYPFIESQAPIPIPLPETLQIELEVQAPLGLVMSDGRDLLGVLLMGGPEPVGPRRALLAGIAHQISLRMENARLVDELAARRTLERELEMARGIQENFLPDLVPQYPGWDVGATWLVARQVGGDFFDFIDLPDEGARPKVGIVVADVADKGIPAALFMALCITLLRSVATTISSPAHVLARLNELLFSQTRTDMFVSVFYGVLDLEKDVLTYANGGHNPPGLVDRDGNMKLLTDHGMVLGVSELADYNDQQIQLLPDERLVLYTDGVTEATSRDGELFGMQRLADLLRASPSAASQELAQSVKLAVIEFCEGDPSDDLTTVILRRTD